MELVVADGTCDARCYEIIRERAAWLRERGVEQWSPPYPYHRFAQEVSRGEVFALFVRGAMAGTVTLLRDEPDYYPEIPWKSHGPSWYICRLAIARFLGGNGFGQQALDIIERTARTAGVMSLRLDVVASNPFLERYYAAHRFSAVVSGVIRGTPSVFMEHALNDVVP